MNPLSLFSSKSGDAHFGLGLLGMNPTSTAISDLSFMLLGMGPSGSCCGGDFLLPLHAKRRSLLSTVDFRRSKRGLRCMDTNPKLSKSLLLVRRLGFTTGPTVATVSDVGEGKPSGSKLLNPKSLCRLKTFAGRGSVQNQDSVRKSQSEKTSHPICLVCFLPKRARCSVLPRACHSTTRFTYVPDFTGARVCQSVDEVSFHG